TILLGFVFIVYLYLCAKCNEMSTKPNRKLGRPKNLSSPKRLWELFCDYYDEVKDNPAKKQDIIRGGELAGTTIELKLEKPITWAGFESMLRHKNIIAKLEDYKANKEKRYTDFAEVVARIEQKMWDDKFSGAAVGIYNANIIARDLGLSEKSESTITME